MIVPNDVVDNDLLTDRVGAPVVDGGHVPCEVRK
jgi:hypothetical protein